jgi:hypothetical protein
MPGSNFDPGKLQFSNCVLGYWILFGLVSAGQSVFEGC